MSALYEKILRPLLFQLDPENAHHLAMGMLQRMPRFILNQVFGAEKSLPADLFGLRFPNPVGLAAGFDKNALALPAWESLGFGFVEAGTITAKPQPGNPSPRVFRYPQQQALINRMGFNNDGADAVAARLERLKQGGNWPGIPVGLNIGKSKVTPLEEATGDYLHSFRKLHPYADYFVLNVSSPNTPGLRQLQGREALNELLGAIQESNQTLQRKPVLVKIAPDLDFPQIEDVIVLALEHQLAGIVATNTTLDHSSIPSAQNQEGGLSGLPLQKRSTEIVRFITSRSNLPVIAAGGIFHPDAAMEKLDAGAVLLQIYTGFIYRGPRLIQEICARLRSSKKS
jgi:dihydroorotate dehydrogenase